MARQKDATAKAAGPAPLPAFGGALAPATANPASSEQQGRNAAHYIKVAEWRAIIDGHHLFSNISQELPLSVADAGTQHPFNNDELAIAIARDDGSYTAGINLFWCEPLYSPAPSIPIRADTIPDLVDVYFSTPAAIPHPVCISLRPGERPLDKRGALMAINPEEMRHAMMSAIARDMRPASTQLSSSNGEHGCSVARARSLFTPPTRLACLWQCNFARTSRTTTRP